MSKEIQFDATLVGSWSPNQGIPSDLVVCGASPENVRDEAMFPEAHLPSVIESWSEISLNTPLQVQSISKTQDRSSSLFQKKVEKTSLRLSFGFHESSSEDHLADEKDGDAEDTTKDEEAKDGHAEDINKDVEEQERDAQETKDESDTGSTFSISEMNSSPNRQSDILMCINCGESQSLGIDFQNDSYFMGGEEMRIEDSFVEALNLSVYRSARMGKFGYEIGDLLPGDYFIDLHFAEIIHINGPRRMRVFDVYVQEVKILSELDIYARVGSVRPLIVTNIHAHVVSGGSLTIKFEAIVGSPLVSAICIKRVPLEGHHVSECSTIIEARDFKCIMNDLLNKDQEIHPFEEKIEAGPHCSSTSEESSKEVDCKPRNFECSDISCKDITPYEKEIQELREKIDFKNKECSELQVSVQNLNNQLESLRKELMRKSMHVGSLAQAVEGQVSELSTLKQRFAEECMERKQLYNKLLEMKGNIRVFCRCRPLNEEEISKGTASVVEFDAARDCEITVRGNGAPKKIFKFDSVFTPQSNQADVFAKTAPVVVSVLDGYNVCIFAYGQTGTGKTFTMEGPEELRGVNYRTLEELFQVARDRQGQFNYNISVSALEVYNEQIRDLLASMQPGQSTKRLEVKKIPEGQYRIPGLIEAQVHNSSEAWEVLQTGSSARAVGATNANEHSSRSHCLICVMVKGHNLITGEHTRSKLWLIDLAGSERLAKTDVQGERLKEAQNINKSLAALGDVIHALSTKSSHIPFRNSKLTHLLQDSLGGDSKAIMFVQISPSENDVCETLCSLNFASRVRGVELGPAKKQYDVGEIVKYKQLVDKTKIELKSKDAAMKKMEETIQILETKLKGREQSNKTLQDKIRELEEQLEGERRARSSLEIKLKDNLQTDKLQEKPPQMRQFRALKPIEDGDAFSRDLVNLSDALAENVLSENKQKQNILSCNEKAQGHHVDHNLRVQKENNADMYDQTMRPMRRRAGRTSLCTAGQRKPGLPLPRRVSMVPLTDASTDLSMRSSGGREEEVKPAKNDPQTNVNDVGMTTGHTHVSLRGVRTSQVLNKLRRSLKMKVQGNTPPLSKGTVHGDTANNANWLERNNLPPLDPNKHRRVSCAKVWEKPYGTGNIPAAQRVPIKANLNALQLREKERGWNR